MTQEEITKIIEKSKAPQGVIARGANGQIYFISEKDAAHMALPSDAKYSDTLSAVLQKTGSRGAPKERLTQQSCDNIADWLTSHSPNTHPEWMGVAAYFLDHC